MISSTTIEKMRLYLSRLKVTIFGRFFFYCIPFRRSVVMANLNFIFKNYLTQDEIKKIALSFYSHLANTLYENLIFRFQRIQTVREKIIVRGENDILKASEKMRGVILLTGHYGNWELAPIGAILNFPQYKNYIHIVRKTLHVRWIEKWVFRRFYQVGLNVISWRNSLSQVCDLLEKNHVVIFVFDQHASAFRKEGINVNFLGKQAGTFRSLAMLAQTMGSEVVPCRTYRRKDGRHIVEFFPALEWISNENPKEEILLNTQHYNSVLEKFVLEYPDQWLWLHKRWKVCVENKKNYSSLLDKIAN